MKRGGAALGIAVAVGQIVVIDEDKRPVVQALHANIGTTEGGAVHLIPVVAVQLVFGVHVGGFWKINSGGLTGGGHSGEFRVITIEAKDSVRASRSASKGSRGTGVRGELTRCSNPSATDRRGIHRAILDPDDVAA